MKESGLVMLNQIKTFAESYQRDQEHPSWILFPRDSEWRRELFGPEAQSHPAKMQLNIVKAAVEYYAQPGWRILDPFAGTGSTALAATMGCPTTLIELEDHFVTMLREIRSDWMSNGRISSLMDMMIFTGDCRQVLKQIPEKAFDMIITSPPYSVTAQVSNRTIETEDRAEYKSQARLVEVKAQMRKYGSSEASAMNIGRLNKFMFNEAMKRVYQACLRVLKPGGLYVSVTKDSMIAGVRQSLSLDMVRIAQSAGLEYTGDWYKWKAPGGLMQNMQRAKGLEVVLDEDVITFRRPV